FAQMVEQEVARMEKLLAGVREISVIDARLGREEHAPLELGALLAKIVDGFRLREGARARFELTTSDAPLTVDASEDRLIQVFENLLDNAASFSPAGGAVRVGVQAEGWMAVIRIEDEGPGIPEAHMTRIFDRFFTYRPAAARRDSRHTGLGLSIVRAIVAGYGGTVSGANGAQGAVFEVRLPVART
ncbi:MAG TPA: ATP-binding protein, partial [Thermoanaerobaculia bacterium]|nr:ATP-binding protein [Thermoanaerobaculia bacterium]